MNDIAFGNDISSDGEVKEKYNIISACGNIIANKVSNIIGKANFTLLFAVSSLRSFAAFYAMERYANKNSPFF